MEVFELQTKIWNHSPLTPISQCHCYLPNENYRSYNIFHHPFLTWIYRRVRQIPTERNNMKCFWLICEPWQRIHPWCKSLQHQARRHITKPNKKRSYSIWAISTKTGNYPCALRASGPRTSRQTLFLLFSRTAFFIFVAGMACKGGVGSLQLKVASLASLAFFHGKLKIWDLQVL